MHKEFTSEVFLPLPHTKKDNEFRRRHCKHGIFLFPITDFYLDVVDDDFKYAIKEYNPIGKQYFPMLEAYCDFRDGRVCSAAYIVFVNKDYDFQLNRRGDAVCYGIAMSTSEQKLINAMIGEVIANLCIENIQNMNAYRVLMPEVLRD